ncbi:hypothetical protein O1W69_05120 [Chlamydia sp. 12-01]|uniref:hypothetical protein n=1 Tax=Chlamydia sp. 12-01 TaxID=3002742 RepID=UPI0035D3E374
MFINKYPDNDSFYNATKNYSYLLRSSFVRTSYGILSIDWEWDFSEKTCVFRKSGILEIQKVTPILGTISGLGRLYSIWSTINSDTDLTTSTKELFLHTLTGIIETLGLGIILLITKIILMAIQKLWQKISPCCCCNRYKKLKNSSVDSKDFETSASNLDKQPVDLSTLTPERFQNLFSTNVQGDPTKGESVTVELTVNPDTLDDMINATAQLFSNITNLDDNDEEGFIKNVQQLQDIVGSGALQNEVKKLTTSLKGLSSSGEEEEDF